MSEPTALFFLTVLTSLPIQPEPAEFRLYFLLPGGGDGGRGRRRIALGVGGIGRGCSRGRGLVGGLLAVTSRQLSGVLVEAGVQIDQIKASLIGHGIICWTLGRGDARALGHRRGRINVGLGILVVLELAQRQG